MSVSTDKTHDVEHNLLQFLAERTKRTWEPEEDLFASGAVSSLFALQLVMHLEQQFSIAVDGEDLTLNNFRTVSAMAALVRRLQGSHPGDSDD